MWCVWRDPLYLPSKAPRTCHLQPPLQRHAARNLISQGLAPCSAFLKSLNVEPHCPICIHLWSIICCLIFLLNPVYIWLKLIFCCGTWCDSQTWFFKAFPYALPSWNPSPPRMLSPHCCLNCIYSWSIKYCNTSSSRSMVRRGRYITESRSLYCI